VLLAETRDDRAWWHAREDVDAGLPVPDLHSTLESISAGYRLRVTTRGFLRDLAVLVDRLAPDAEVDNMLVTLLPGETAVFTISTAATLTLEQVTNPLVLRSANQLVAD
jgi:beta-mannosidase